MLFSNDTSGFVLLSDAVPDVLQDIRYYSAYNFVGARIDGYEAPVALLTREAASVLKEVSDVLLSQGYRLKVYDAYRPQMAVAHFIRWANDPTDTRMKATFYPDIEKETLIPQGYLAPHSGHSRGSTVDLTLVDLASGRDVDMGGAFDDFGVRSHTDFTDLTRAQAANRTLLRETMTAHGFLPLKEEWWHFTLQNEPYPDTYFTFPINCKTVEQIQAAASD